MREKDVLDRKAVEALKRLYAQTAKNARRAGRQSEHSWKAVAGRLGFNVGYIYNVANGNKRASNRLLHALGLPMRTVAIAVCPDCGELPLAKRHHCPARVPGKPRAKRRNWRGLALVLAGVLVNHRRKLL
jgi:hypothetical protein